ncbi:hypothetical protein HN51_019463 [Arachis hypogaea]|uniref:isoprene synthase, chloroplastic n=1 Tax=Arachis hypogaea TaxID=3818 RepID=UPI000DEC7C85|nr:isoprene synthase, chloroplastic [Arachis hypogaea]QHO31227.1 Isoprene synthase [Arachis hypogaea]
MASELISLPYALSTTQRVVVVVKHRNHFGRKTVTHATAKIHFICGSTKKDDGQLIGRRSANYQPNLWTYEFLHHQSHHNHHVVERIEERAKKLEEKVRYIMMNSSDMEPLSLLEFIDDLHRLGLSYKFPNHINSALSRIHSSQHMLHHTQKTLHATALLFRILRQHSFHVSQDVFESFNDDEGNLKAEIGNDVQGMLTLYEASHLNFDGETLCEKARAFSATNMMNIITNEGTENKVKESVRRVLEGLPSHHSPYRVEARGYIDTYHKNEPHNQLLLELAKLDFNMLQSLHQQELQQMARWWRDMGLASKLSFARDRLTESFFWSLGIVSHPNFSYCRKELTKVAALVTVLDDVYDVHGTLDELELFTDAVERWDVNAINDLPDYMTLCFLALYNTVNEIAFDIFKDHAFKCLPHLKKAWCDLCKSFLQEAKWSNNKVVPRLKEYLENGLVSCSGGICLIHSFFLLNQETSEQALHSLINYHELLRSSSTIFRISNDLATSADEMECGETANSMTCYMNETGDSEEDARRYLRSVIDEAWKNMNRCLVMDSTFDKSFIEVAMNLARIAQFTYQHGDGHGRPDNRSKTRIKSLLVDPIPVNVPT